MAATKLNFTEERATVILVSDGNENCGVDPSELGVRSPDKASISRPTLSILT